MHPSTSPLLHMLHATSRLAVYRTQPPKVKTGFDPLPVVFQNDPESAPQMFELPSSLIDQCIVDIWHPDYPFLPELDLKWYSIPLINIHISVGGITFSCIPFNGE